jgi:UDP-2,4-diacetamido-2,4,6-trideoxy-beta-L-altropyranose hydrolase
MSVNYLLRADASTSIGSGHIMRMIALGQMLQDQGRSVHFATITENEDMLQRISDEDFKVHRIGHSPDWQYLQDAEQVVKLADELDVEWVILDGYHFNAPYQKIIKEHGCKLMCMDDIAQCHFYADLVVNQNINASASLYSAEKYTRFVLGPKNAMLRREYIQAGKGFKRRSAQKPENFLVTMGGSDPLNLTRKVCEALDTLNGHKICLKVIVGALNPNYEDILSFSKTSRNRIEVFRNLGKELPELMKWADIGIFAAGSTIFEGLYFDLPLFCCLLASNQNINYVPTTHIEDKYKDIFIGLRSIMDFFLLQGIDVSCFNVKTIL